MKKSNFYFKDLITWKKQRGIGMRKGWLYTREEILWYVKDNKKFIWNKDEQYSNERRKRDKGKDIILPSQTGYFAKSLYKRLTNVWEDISESTFNISSNNISNKHLTPKPVDAIERIIKAHTKENELVLDCFMGSGTTAIACINTNRNYIGFELDKNYYDIANQRIQDTLAKVS